MIEIIFALVGIGIGFLIGYLTLRPEVVRQKARSESLETSLAEARSAAEESLSRQNDLHNNTLDAMQRRFDETIARLRAELEAHTSELLRERQTQFDNLLLERQRELSASNSENLSKILDPLNVSIKAMRDAVNDNTLRHTEFGGQLSANIRQVLAQSEAARQSADRLADALRGGGKIQGNWGETVLTELLESQGLKEGVHFDTQAFLTDASGNKLRSESGSGLQPDVILHLDKNRAVIIDAKVSLSAYLDYVQAETDETREQALKAHLRSVEGHVNELVGKDYSKYLHKGVTSVGYVIMFVPNSTALYAATSQKPDLWRKAMERGVYIADEQTLYAALKIVSLTWRQIAQAENHEKVFSLANEMLERVNKFMEHYLAIGKKLDDAQKAFNAAGAKLRESGQSIPTTCRKLVELGASVKLGKGVEPELVGLTAKPYPELEE